MAGASPEEVSAHAAEFQKALQTGPGGYWQKNLEVTLNEYHKADGRYYPALVVAHAYARVGDRDHAMEWLEKSYGQRDSDLTLVKSFPEFKALRGDHRFSSLLRRIGLPSE